MGYGMLSHLGVCFQTSYGTALATSYHWMPILNESIALAKPPLESEAHRGRFEAGDSYEGMNAVAGDIVLEVHPIQIGRFLKAFCGQASASAVQTSHYTHTFRPKASDWDALCALPPLTIEKYMDAGSAHQYKDCVVDALSFEIAGGALIKATASIIGGGGFAKVAKSTPSYLTGSEMTWDQTSISITGGAIKDLTITMANNVEAIGTLDGTKTAGRIKRSGFRTAEISGTLLFESDTEFDNFRNQTAQRIAVCVKGSECGSGYYNNLTFDMPNAKYRELPVAIAGPGLIEAAFTADARWSATSGTMIDITLINTLAAY